MDIVPGMVTFFWFTPTRTGTFESICAELCGTGHYTMRGAVVVDEESAYQAWLQEQSTFKQSLARSGNDTGDTLSLTLREQDRFRGKSNWTMTLSPTKTQVTKSKRVFS
jgi:heme/copper-type cytochrome/quinol oxidase subunit 2